MYSRLLMGKIVLTNNKNKLELAEPVLLVPAGLRIHPLSFMQ